MPELSCVVTPRLRPITFSQLTFTASGFMSKPQCSPWRIASM